MGHIEANHSVLQTSDPMSIIDDSNGTTIHPYVLQMIRIYSNPYLLILFAIPVSASALGIVANLLLIYYIIHKQRHHSSIFALILCLALCDLSTCCAVIFLDDVFIILSKPGFLCPFTIFVFYISYTATGYHIVAISIIRFYQLVYPLSARARITPSLCLKLSVIIWALSAGYAIPFARYYLWVVVPRVNDTPATVCFYTGDPLVRELCITIVMMALPPLLTAVFHAAKHCIVTKQTVPEFDSASSGQDNKRQTTDTRGVVTVITVAIIANLPSIVHRGMHGIFQVPYLSWHIYITSIGDHMSTANSIINPFIYAFVCPSVRDDIKAMFRK